MPNRMDRYKKDSSNTSVSRSSKNKELYEELSNNTKYTNLSDVSKLTAVDLNKAKNSRTRESYQQIKEYNIIKNKPKVQKELDEINYLYQDHENRVYDINSILEEARKNRETKDELEKKRRLKNDDFNAVISKDEELKKFHDKKQTKETASNSDQKIQNLLDTIASKTLTGEIDAKTTTDLLSNLMAEDDNDKIEAMEAKPDEKELEPDEELNISKKIIDKAAISVADSMKALSKDQMVPKKNIEKTIDDIFKDMDHSFYTRSMDLSDKDFVKNLGDEKESRHIFIKVLFCIMILAVILTVVYFVVFDGDIDNVMKLIKK